MTGSKKLAPSASNYFVPSATALRDSIKKEHIQKSISQA